MKIQSAEFETSATTLAGAPRLPLPEFAFIGRSNVGKSSLLNILVEKKDLARVSSLPGKTQLMNFYTINRNWRLVDLPGYGYAHVAKTQRADFNEAAAHYLESRENLKATFVLIDPRHEPHAIDLAFLEWIIETGVRFAVVFTKTDKLSASQARAGIDRFVASSGLDQLDPLPEFFTSSSKTKAGRSEILRYISAQL